MPFPLEDDRADGPLANGLRFQASPPRLLASHAARNATGLGHWVDGTMGIARRGDRTTVLAPNGRSIARHEVRGDLRGAFAGAGLATTLEAQEQGIARPREPMDHASGGPVLVDPRTGSLLLVYHGEQFPHGDPSVFWSFVGMAVSDDGGRTFEDLGAVLRPPAEERPPHDPRTIEVGPGSFAVRDGWFHLYFLDRADLEQRIGLGVARIEVDRLWADVHARRTPQLATWCDGSFSQPALGGRASDLLPGRHARVIWFDVAVLEPLGLTLLVHATVTDVVDRRGRWTHVARVSEDGVSFSSPLPLYDDSVEEELIYLTIDSGGPDQRSIVGDGFDLYRMAARTPYRWDDARLEHVRVSWSTVTS